MDDYRIPEYKCTPIKFGIDWQFYEVCSGCYQDMKKFEGESLKNLCSRCGSVRYCGRECQVKNHYIHKSECKMVVHSNAEVKKARSEGDQKKLASALMSLVWPKFKMVEIGFSSSALEGALENIDRAISHSEGKESSSLRYIRDSFYVARFGPDKFLLEKLGELCKLSGFSMKLTPSDLNFETTAKPIIAHLKPPYLYPLVGTLLNLLLAYSLKLRCTVEEVEVMENGEELRKSMTKDPEKLETFKTDFENAVRNVDNCLFFMAMSSRKELEALSNHQSISSLYSGQFRTSFPFFEFFGLMNEVIRSTKMILRRTKGDKTRFTKELKKILKNCDICDGRCSAWIKD